MPTDRPVPVPDFLYGTAWKEERTPALTELALRTGFRAIDTANQRRHYFEAGVGQGLAAAYRAGLVTRADLFLQTKFTYRDGQDHRLPYDPEADLSTQVAQSMASSLEHLGTDHVDSYVLHGPASGYEWTGRRRPRLAGDGEGARCGPHPAPRREQCVPGSAGADAGHRRRDPRVRPESLLRPPRMGPRGAVVLRGARASSTRGSRCSRRTRRSCATRSSPALPRASSATPAQVVFRFAQAVGMLPLTGTSDPEHMVQDLASHALTLSPDEVRTIESLSG